MVSGPQQLNLSTSPPPTALRSFDCPAAGGGQTINNKLHWMDSGTSVILDPPEHTNATAATAAAGPRKVQFSKYKGVVPQPNGRWGCPNLHKKQAHLAQHFQRREYRSQGLRHRCTAVPWLGHLHQLQASDLL
ncbi:hypothetical protein Droror1_Dr00017861 [Drosera rotundifolia]